MPTGGIPEYVETCTTPEFFPLDVREHAALQLALFFQATCWQYAGTNHTHTTLETSNQLFSLVESLLGSDKLEHQTGLAVARLHRRIYDAGKPTAAYRIICTLLIDLGEFPVAAEELSAAQRTALGIEVPHESSKAAPVQ